MAEKVKERKEIDEKYKWDITHLYKSPAAWEKDVKTLNTELKTLSGMKGTLSRSPEHLARCLDLYFTISKRFALIHSYASRLHDQDAQEKLGQELHERVNTLSTRVESETSFIEPEILSIPEHKFKKFISSKHLEIYSHYLDNVNRRRPHTLDPQSEKLIAEAGDMAQVPLNVYMTLSTLNVQYPTVKLSDGREIVLDQAMYSRYRGIPARQDREKIFKTFWTSFAKYRETFAGLLSGAIKRDSFYARVRKYKSNIEAALDKSNIPVSIYTTMIKQVRAGLPSLWRYLNLKKRILGIDTLEYHDLYASIVPEIEMKIPWSKVRPILEDALKPLGPDYVALLRKAEEERWTDVFPNKGKRSGAYMSGWAYDVHPYMLMNYNDDFDSLSTFAHEFGHAGHSYLSNKNQPYHNAHYPIFIAEVASITNEQLLRLFYERTVEDDARALFITGQYLESWRTTVFRQCLFAEFELKIHEAAQKGQPITADYLDNLYLELLRDYYGEKEGIVKIDPLYAVEWSYIPHFYYNFYMFQYTTSFIASVAIAENIHSGNTAARDKYISMLKAGGSRYPLELLKMAGVDMTRKEPYRIAFNSMEKSINRIEELTDAKAPLTGNRRKKTSGL